MHTDVSRHAFELLCHLDHGLDVFFLAHALVQHGLQLERVVVLVAFFLHFRRIRQGVRHTRFSGNQLRDAVAEGVAHVHDTAHVTNRRLGSHGAKSGDLADGVFAVLFLHIVDHPVAIGLAEVDIEVGHRNPLGVQETLKQQVVFQRVQIRDLEGVGHQRTGARPPTRAHGAAIVLGPLNEVTHNEKVPGEPHLEDGAQLKLQALYVTRPLFVAPCLVRVQVLEALFQTFKRGKAEILLRRHAVGRRESRQLRFAQHQRQTAALGNFYGVG